MYTSRSRLDAAKGSPRRAPEGPSHEELLQWSKELENDALHEPDPENYRAIVSMAANLRAEAVRVQESAASTEHEQPQESDNSSQAVSDENSLQAVAPTYVGIDLK